MSIEDDILIGNFLREKLSKEEKKHFLNRVENDVSFKKTFLFEKQLLETLNDKEWNSGNHNPKEIEEYKELFESEETKELEKIIKKVGNSYHESRNKSNLTKWLLSSAATIAILFTVYTLFFKSVSNQELYATYVQKTELPSLIERSENQKDLVKAQQYFEANEYDKALSVFEKELKNTKIQDATIYVYIGISQMELNQFDEAEKTFNNLISSDLLDAPKGKWYKALLYVKSNNINKAKQELTEIVNTSSYNFGKAKKLLQKL